MIESMELIHSIQCTFNDR